MAHRFAEDTQKIENVPWRSRGDLQLVQQSIGEKTNAKSGNIFTSSKARIPPSERLRSRNKARQKSEDTDLPVGMDSFTEGRQEFRKFRKFRISYQLQPFQARFILYLLEIYRVPEDRGFFFKISCKYLYTTSLVLGFFCSFP